MSRDAERRPGVGTVGGAEGYFVDDSILTDDELRSALCETLVVVVRDTKGNYRRRVFLTLKAAERAMRAGTRLTSWCADWSLSRRQDGGLL